MKVVVTAGPTREYIDPVRFLTNESSGKMGFAIAQAAAEAGHEAVLIAGPVQLETPPGVRRRDVVSAQDMLSALQEEFKDAGALFMAAAVADYRPAVRHEGKWKAKEAGAGDVLLALTQNPDLLATVARDKGERLVVGFALETNDGERRALEKLERKNADYVVLNGATALNADTTSVTILGRRGVVQRLDDRSKPQVARALVALLDKEAELRA